MKSNLPEDNEGSLLGLPVVITMERAGVIVSHKNDKIEILLLADEEKSIEVPMSAIREYISNDEN